MKKQTIKDIDKQAKEELRIWEEKECRCMGIPATIRDSSDCPIHKEVKQETKSETLNNLKKKVEEKKFPENGRGTKYGEGYNYAIENVLELIEKEKK